MKFHWLDVRKVIGSSHLSRGAWIEMAKHSSKWKNALPSHLSRGAWIEIVRFEVIEMEGKSHLSRGAWIEI